MKNLHELLNARNKKVLICFDRSYCPEICLSEPGQLDITSFIASKQERFYGNHLLEMTEEVDQNSGNRTIQLGNFIFTVAQLFVEVDGQIYRLNEKSGFLFLNPNKNGERAILAKMKRDFNYLTLSKKAMIHEMLKV